MNFRRKPKLIEIIAGGIVAILLAVAIYIHCADYGTLITHYLELKLGRDVTIGKATVVVEKNAHVELDDIHVANQPWGSTPDMVYIRHIEADFDPWRLIRGPLQLDKIAIDGLKLVLERDKDGTGNWKNGPSFHTTNDASTDEPDFSAVDDRGVEQRADLPAILAMAVHDSEITFRTSSMAMLKIDFKDLQLATGGNDEPITLTVDGAYNDHPVRLDIATQSFNVLHDLSRTFNAKIKAVSNMTEINLNADMMDPLNFDQVRGQLDIKTGNLGEMAELLSADFHADLPLSLQGILERRGDDWHVQKATGQFGDSQISGDIELIEGPRLHPDKTKFALDIDRLDVNYLLAKMHMPGKKRDVEDEHVIPIEHKPGIITDSDLAIKRLTYHRIRLEGLKFHILTEPNYIALSNIDTDFMQANFKGEISARNIDNIDHVKGTVSMSDLDIVNFMNFFDMKTHPLEGHLDARMSLETFGKTLNDFKLNGDGHMVIAMNAGRISQKAIRLASTDVREVFGSPTGMAPVSCVLMVANAHRGLMTLNPLRVKTNEGTLFGGGQVNFAKEDINLTFKTERKTTNFFALDLPVHIVGTFDDPHAGPVINSAIGNLKAKTSDNILQLPPTMRTFADQSDCAN